MSLSKTLYPLLSTGSMQEDWSETLRTEHMFCLQLGNKEVH